MSAGVQFLKTKCEGRKRKRIVIIAEKDTEIDGYLSRIGIYIRRTGRPYPTMFRAMRGRQERRKTGRRRQETGEGRKDYQMRR